MFGDICAAPIIDVVTAPLSVSTDDGTGLEMTDDLEMTDGLEMT